MTHPVPRAAMAESIAEQRRAREREYFRKYRAEHPELLDYYRAYYRAHKDKHRERNKSEKHRAYMKEYRKRNRAKLRELEKAWRARNPEKASAIAAKHQVARRPAKRIADALYRKQKPDVYSASIARAKAAKPGLYREIARASQGARRVRKRGAPIEKVSLARIERRDRGLCHLCGARVNRIDRSFDHLIPVVRLGAHAEWNLMLAHLSCNRRRGTKRILVEETKAGAQAYIDARCQQASA